MKRLSHLYEKLVDVDHIEKCIHKAFKKKVKTRSIKKILSNPRKHAERISWLIKEGKLPFIRERKILLITDGKQKKKRTITKASNYEHIFHHALMALLEEKFTNSSYRYAIASFPKRGDLFGKKRMERWIRSFKGRKLYVLKFDIKKFFDTIDRQILLTKLEKIIKDRKVLDLLYKLIYFDGSSTNKGVPIGYYSSQWFANFYLQDFDNFIKQTLRIKPYMRYMDDGVILHQNKRKLRKILSGLRLYLSENLNLTLKKTYQIFMLSYRPTWLMLQDGWKKNVRYGRPLDFMGYKFYPWATTIRKSTLRSTRRAALRFSKRRSLRNAMSLMSYYGRLRHTAMYDYYVKWLKPVISFDDLRQVISKMQPFGGT